MTVALDIEHLITERMEESMEVSNSLLQNANFVTLVSDVGLAMTQSLRNGGTVFFFGNGGRCAAPGSRTGGTLSDRKAASPRSGVEHQHFVPDRDRKRLRL